MSFIKKGDIIVFEDKHYLLCDDSTDENNYIKLLNKIPNQQQFILFTDPPYNAMFNGRSGDFEIICNDNMNDSEFEQFITTWYDCIKKQLLDKYHVNLYIYCNNYLKHIIENIDKDRWVIKNKKPIIWVKNNFGMGSNYRPKYEMLMFDGKIDNDIKNECDVWMISKDNVSEYIHPTQKPVECFSRGIKNHKDILFVIDTFAGSGSSLIASINNNKEWLGMGIDPIYCEKIIRRYYDYTLTNNIYILRENTKIKFEDIKNNLKLLVESKKGKPLENGNMRLF